MDSRIYFPNSNKCQTFKILDFSYSFNDLSAQTNVQNNSTLEISYVGHKRMVITFTGKIPPQFNVTLKYGKGIEREEYFYDPKDQSQYFDLSGNALSSRPSKKGTYIRVVTKDKPEKFTIK